MFQGRLTIDAVEDPQSVTVRQKEIIQANDSDIRIQASSFTEWCSQIEAQHSAGAGTTFRPTSELDTGSLETFSQRRMNITGRFADSFRCLPVSMEGLKKKKTLAQARHRRDCPACAKFTCLATGGVTGYWWVVALHIYIYQCRLIFRQAYDVGNMFEPMFLKVERCFPYIFLHCSLIFRQAFPGAVTRHGVFIYLPAMLWCLHYTYNLINAVRFSDGLGLQNRSRYEAGCCEFTAMVGTLQQLQIF